MFALASFSGFLVLLKTRLHRIPSMDRNLSAVSREKSREIDCLRKVINSYHLRFSLFPNFPRGLYIADFNMNNSSKGKVFIDFALFQVFSPAIGTSWVYRFSHLDLNFSEYSGIFFSCFSLELFSKKLFKLASFTLHIVCFCSFY